MNIFFFLFFSCHLYLYLYLGLSIALYFSASMRNVKAMAKCITHTVLYIKKKNEKEKKWGEENNTKKKSLMHTSILITILTARYYIKCAWVCVWINTHIHTRIIPNLSYLVCAQFPFSSIIHSHTIFLFFFFSTFSMAHNFFFPPYWKSQRHWEQHKRMCIDKRGIGRLYNMYVLFLFFFFLYKCVSALWAFTAALWPHLYIYIHANEYMDIYVYIYTYMYN